MWPSTGPSAKGGIASFSTPPEGLGRSVKCCPGKLNASLRARCSLEFVRPGTRFRPTGSRHIPLPPFQQAPYGSLRSAATPESVGRLVRVRNEWPLRHPPRTSHYCLSPHREQVRRTALRLPGFTSPRTSGRGRRARSASERLGERMRRSALTAMGVSAPTIQLQAPGSS
jgi:hypothetical protein